MTEREKSCEVSKQWGTLRKLTHDQAREEQRMESIKMTAAERLIALAALNRRMYRLQGVLVDDRESGFTVGRLTRRGR